MHSAICLFKFCSLPIVTVLQNRYSSR